MTLTADCVSVSAWPSNPDGYCFYGVHQEKDSSRNFEPQCFPELYIWVATSCDLSILTTRLISRSRSNFHQTSVAHLFQRWRHRCSWFLQHQADPNGFGLFLEVKTMVPPLHQYWLVVSSRLKNIRQLGWLFRIHGKIKNIPNHQSEYFVYLEIYEYYMTCSFLIIHVNQGRNPNSYASCLLPRRFDIITLCMVCHQLQCLSLTVLLRMTDYPSWKIPHAEQQVTRHFLATDSRDTMHLHGMEDVGDLGGINCAGFSSRFPLGHSWLRCLRGSTFERLTSFCRRSAVCWGMSTSKGFLCCHAFGMALQKRKKVRPESWSPRLANYGQLF